MSDLRISFSLVMAIFVLFAGKLPTYAEQAYSHDHPAPTLSPQGGGPTGPGSPAASQQEKDLSSPQTPQPPPPSHGHQHGQPEHGGTAMMKCPMMPMMSSHSHPATGTPSSQSMATMMQGMGLMMQSMGMMMQGMGMMHANPAPNHHHPR